MTKIKEYGGIFAIAGGCFLFGLVVGLYIIAASLCVY